jgi:hypothetical protein
MAAISGVDTASRSSWDWEDIELAEAALAAE